MNTDILLVRHGQTKSNITDFYMGWSEEDLNQVGYNQAYCLSTRLSTLPIASVNSSPLRRTRNTAVILAKPHRLEPRTFNDLIEIQLGGWQGLHIDEIKQRWPELWRQSRTDPSEIIMPDGESFNEVTQRAIRALGTIIEANRGKQALIVTHDIVIKVLVAHVLGVSNSIYRKFEINNASLTKIRVIDDSPSLITLNDISHLVS